MSILTDRDILQYIEKGWLSIDAEPCASIGEKVKGCAINLYLGDIFYRIKPFDPNGEAMCGNEFFNLL